MSVDGLVQIKHSPRISKEVAADATPDERKAMVWTHETGWLPADEYNLSPQKFERRMRKRPREKLMRFKAYFSQEDLQILEKVAAARGQQPSDFVRFATLKLFAELGVVGEERKRLLLAFS
jgi:hypothetical protein